MAGANIYPPILNSWMPAFIQTAPVRIYFALSKYNSYNEIKYIQIVCSAQLTNLSILSQKDFPTGIKMLPRARINIDPDRTGEDKYYITISPDELQDPEIINSLKAFQINQYFKVQLRFADMDSSDWVNEDKNTLNNWTYSNLDHLSEWSTVCIIKAISQPSLQLGIPSLIYHSDTDTYEHIIQPLVPIGNEITMAFIGINGELTFAKGVAEKETLEQYQVTVIDHNGIHVYDSPIIITDSENPNEIYHSINYMFNNNESYIITVKYTTINGYSHTVRYYCETIFNEATDLQARIYTIPDEENSCIVVQITPQLEEGALYVDYNATLEDAYAIYQDQLNHLYTPQDDFASYITILRASDKDNFTCWEDIHTFYMDSYEQINYVYYDYTAEGGVLYKYAIQKRNTEGGRSTPIYETRYVDGQIQPADPKLYAPAHAFLITKDIQLNLALNENIDSTKRVFSENLTETIGSKYPFIRRNGNVNYRQFNISGIISSLVDLEKGETWNSNLHRFEDNVYEQKKKAFYGDNYTYYQKYNMDNNILLQNDIIYEKKYRDKVIQFLTDGKPKLFKSMPEGNILVRLMNISFTPEKTLGRFIYSFQATAIEIADCTIDNYEKYNIIDKINYFGGVV